MSEKLKDLRQIFDDTVFKENYFTEKSRLKVWEKIRKTENNKGIIQMLRKPMMTLMGIAVLFVAVFLIYQSNIFQNGNNGNELVGGNSNENNSSNEDENKNNEDNRKENEDENIDVDFDFDDKVLSVERAHSGPIEVPVNELQEIKDFLIEQGSDAELQFENIKTHYLLDYLDKEFFIISYNCSGGDRCHQLIVEYKDGVTNTIEVLDTGVFTYNMYPNEPFIAILFDRVNEKDVVRQSLYVLDLEKFQLIPIPEEAKVLQSFVYQIATLHWEYNKIVVEIPNIEDTSNESLLQWIDSDDRPTKLIEWEISQ